MAKDRSRRGVHERTMLESPLSATWRPRVRERALLVGVGPGKTEDDLDELAALADSAGAEAVGRIVQTRSDPDPATFVGRGKVEEIARSVRAARADAVIFDDELSPGQLRNLEERLKAKVVDRTALILDIFALHARSREGKAQVELAQLNYLLPRLRGWGEAMSRLGGGIGTRGPGETKLEVDRQHIRRRIAKLRRDLKDLARTRDVKRSGRIRSGVAQIAIAGYTNAGKSTLLNALTEADALVADQLFATLDPTTRRLDLPGGRSAVLTDTVGFVGKLPHQLVEAFRSTLEEVTTASLVLHVADAASPDLRHQIAAVRGVLGEIGAASLPEIVALNKIDLVDAEVRRSLEERYPDAVAISAVTGEGLEALLAHLADAVPRPPYVVELLVPFGREDVTARLHRDAEVLAEEITDAGTVVRARIGDRDLATAGDFVISGGATATRSRPPRSRSRRRPRDRDPRSGRARSSPRR